MQAMPSSLGPVSAPNDWKGAEDARSPDAAYACLQHQPTSWRACGMPRSAHLVSQMGRAHFKTDIAKVRGGLENRFGMGLLSGHHDPRVVELVQRKR